MAARQIHWARRWREKLFDLLGRKCVDCGKTTDLQFDVIIPTGEIDSDGKEKHHRVMNFSWRMSFYRRQYEKGNLQVLCDRCNSRKLNRLQLQFSNAQIEQPF